MELKLTADVVETLPAPDENGLVRVSIALRPGEGGSFTVAEVNDVPTDEAEEEDALDDIEIPTPEQAVANGGFPML